MLMLSLYVLFALGAVIGGANVVARKSPINSAISLLFTFMCLASLYILHGSPFLAMIQIVVYAGAILILVVFTIMLLALREPGLGLAGMWSRPQKIAALVTTALLGGQLSFLAYRGLLETPLGDRSLPVLERVAPATLGRVLFDKYLLPFEVASILLLVAIVGAVVLTRRPRGAGAAIDSPDGDEDRTDSGRPA